MSYPIFLNAVALPRMPDGSKNEWQTFWNDGAVELEANGWPPLLWMALFKPGDMRQARMVDNEDVDSEGRAELEEEFGEMTYPYLLTSIDDALATLAGRRPALLRGIGEKFAPAVDAFAALLKEKFPAYVLCRTGGMVDVPSAGPELQRALADFERLAPGTGGENSIADEMAKLRKQDSRSQMLMLVGSVHEEDAATLNGDALSPAAPATPAAPPSKAQAAPRNSEWLDWACALVVGLPAVGVYLRTHSVLLGVLTFAGVCAVVVLVRVKLLR
jgi:hypothetical protein